MAENVVLGSFATLQNSSIVATLNANNGILTTALADCLSLAGNQPNQMLSNLDMNSQQIINLPAPATLNSPIRLIDFENAVFGSAGSGIYGLLTGNNTWTGLNVFNNIETINSRETITSGLLGNGQQALFVTATQPASPVAVQNAIIFNITGNGSASQNNGALTVHYLAGYTGVSTTRAIQVLNDSASTGNAIVSAGGSNSPSGNFAINSACEGTTTGANIAHYGAAFGGAVNVGNLGLSQVNAANSTNIGAVSSAFNSGASAIMIGAFACLSQTILPTVSAALIADNGTQSSPVFLGRVNNVTKFTIDASGNVQAAALSATSIDSTPVGSVTPSTGTFTVLKGTSTGNSIGTATPVASTTLTVQGADATSATFALQVINSASTLIFSARDDKIVAFNGTVLPNVTNTISLGLSSFAWSNVFSTLFTAAPVTAVPAGSTGLAFLQGSSTANLGFYVGTGTPSFSAAQGSLYLNTTAATTTSRLWINTNGTTGWTFFTSNA